MDTISFNKKRTLSVVAVDSNGVEQQVDGPFVWTVDPTGGVQLFPTPDGKSCDVVNLAPLTQTVKVEADSDLTAGVTLISNTVEIQTLAAPPPPATTINITVGPETDV